MRAVVFTLILAIALPAAAQEGSAAGLPPYPTAASVPFDGSMRTNDVPLDAVVVMTSDPIKQVMEYYRTALAQRGIEPMEHMFSPQSGYVGFFDETSGTMRMATVTTRPGGGSMLILSSMDPRPLVTRPVGIPADLPSLPGAENVVTTLAPLGPGKQRTVSFTLSEVAPGEARSRLIQASAGLGWHVAPSEKPFGNQDLILNRGREMCVIRLSTMPAEGSQEPTLSVTMVVIDRGPTRNQGD
jgi:hypothetical protein